jgi:hypothetical protein
MAKISTNFYDWELVVSAEHPHLITPVEDLDFETVANAMRLVLDVMQPARDVAGRLDVLSFCRSLQLNDAVGGVADSDHLDGLACDFRPALLTAVEFFEMARDGLLECAWDKLNLYTETDTLHVSIRRLEDGPPRGRLFIDWQEVE